MGCLPKKRNDLSAVWKYIPLAAYAVGFAVLQIGYPVFSLITQAKDTQGEHTDAAAWISYVFNGLQIVFGLVALVSILLKWLPGMRIYDGALHYMVMSWLVYIAVVVVVLSLKKGSSIGLGDNLKVWSVLTITIAFAFILCTLAYFMRSCLASLLMVIQSGGHGFERLNYKQLKTGVCRRAFTRADCDNDTLSDFNAEP